MSLGSPVACSGTHVGERADDAPEIAFDGGQGIDVGDARDSEVEDLGAPVFADQDVGGLEVAMDDARDDVRVRRRDRVR